MQRIIRLIMSLIVILVLIPLTLYVGMTIFADRKYYFISIVIMILACIPFLLSFERRNPQPREILVIAVMSAISVAGRALFVVTPGFKPVAAITAITGFSLGAEAGFLTGAMSALVSNMFFGQGPWTPFQMFMWGMIGFIAGLLGKTGMMHKKIPLIVFGIFAGIFFSFGMDIWGTISMYGVFSWEAYALALTSAVPFMIIYAISNVIFLLLLAKPIREKLDRIKNKYGILQ
ncbi:ECF transporter S component [Lysinibacillus pakistanensis]|uniref:ECF transporter S component n=1 Tax=Lysinibacillus pakistanensis TaxID=759811 RepID=A0AAX3WQP0_9BACI|nr:ECF transporter S component [Lysinibacillus pakistanensis]MDM5234531.1 ECF transporter S component [Lysinibacillus pakistanensis]WHY45108.1 ECF transporter S component [Lysinibacillus pakistanensis]WHY50117.1 ECF transporter S component [Lysinibacillus pakistanensis]